jgi:hypothetical protein
MGLTLTDLKQTLKKYLPALAFVGGFIWDALTIGRRVNALDLLILSVYLIATVFIIKRLVKKTNMLQNNAAATTLANHPLESEAHWKDRLPYLILQFLFGSLFCALFILYFKSASHLTAIAWSLVLAVLLIANEFLENHYKRFTVIWTLFGFCLVLLLNFVLPYLVGSVHWVWFYISILVAVVITHFLKKAVSPNLGYIYPSYLIAIIVASAYVFDVIPPVPLVKRDIAVGVNLEKVEGKYVLEEDKSPPFRYLRNIKKTVHMKPGQKVYCLSAVFAPAGLKTKLYHRWEYLDPKKGWQMVERIGFDLIGGRNNGFRGYTFKQNLKYGEWRVIVETEYERTITSEEFVLKSNDEPQKKILKTI